MRKSCIPNHHFFLVVIIVGSLFLWPAFAAAKSGWYQVDHKIFGAKTSGEISPSLRLDAKQLTLQSAQPATPGLLSGWFVSEPLTSPFPFNAISWRFRGVFPAEGHLDLFVSIYRQGTWSAWKPVIVDDSEVANDSSLQPGESYLGGLFLLASNSGEKLRYRLELSTTQTRSSPQISQILVAFMDTVIDIPAPSVTPSGSQAPTATYPKPTVVSRSQWGADDPQCSLSYCAVNHLCVHHTASTSDYDKETVSQCGAAVKAIQNYHMYTNGWCDIGYNYLVCKTGDLFEGRAGGDDVLGAHDSYNCGSMGISFLGYYHPPYNQLPTAQSLDAIEELFAWKADQKGIDPHGISYYQGFGGTMDNIYGHRDVSNTACPGDTLYPKLGEIRDQVEQKIKDWKDPGDPTKKEIIVDNADAGFAVSGDWTTGTSSSDKYGADYRWSSTGTAAASATWSPALSGVASYEVFVWYPQGSNRSSNAEFTVLHRTGQTVKMVNQQTGGGQWNSLGTYDLGPASGVVLSNGGDSGFVVIADAIKFVQLTDPVSPICGLISSGRPGISLGFLLSILLVAASWSLGRRK